MAVLKTWEERLGLGSVGWAQVFYVLKVRSRWFGQAVYGFISFGLLAGLELEKVE